MWSPFRPFSMNIDRRGLHTRTGVGGWAIFARKNISTAPEKNCYACLQNCFARLTPPNNY